VPKNKTVFFVAELHAVEGVDTRLVHGDGEVLRGPRAAKLVEDLLDVEALLERERARGAVACDLDAEQDVGLAEDLDVVARAVGLDEVLVGEVAVVTATPVADDHVVDVDCEAHDAVGGDLAPDVRLDGALLVAEALDGLRVADHPEVARLLGLLERAEGGGGGTHAFKFGST